MSKKPSLVADFLGALQLFVRGAADKPQSSAAIRKQIAGLDVDALESVVEQLEGQRRRLLLSASHEEIAALDLKIAAANRAADRGVALRDELQRLLAEAEGRETAAGLAAQRAEAEALAQQAIDEIQNTMRRAFADIRRVIAAVLEAEAAAETVNSYLPVEQHVISPEMWRNSTGGGTETVLTRKTVTLWAYESNGNRVGEREARSIVDQGGGRGILPSVGSPVAGIVNLPAGGQLVSDIPVVRRRFFEVKFLPGISSSWLSALADAVKLPPIRGGEPEGWDSRNRNSTLNDGLETLQELINRIDRESARGPTDDRSAQVRFEPHVEGLQSDEQEAA